MPDDAPLIISALLDEETQNRLDALRRRHFPAERNHLAAHLTLFHHLDPVDEPEIHVLLESAARRLPLPAFLGEVRNLGRGVAIGIDCPLLVELRRSIADEVPGELTPQDAQWHWPHVTVQNKVEPAQAARLQRQLARELTPGPAEVVGLALWRYRGGPWDPVASFGIMERP